MTTIPDLPERISDHSLETVRGAISLLQEERERFETFIGDMLDGLESMRVDMQDRESELAQTRDLLLEKQSQMDAALEEIHAKQELSERRRVELEELAAELTGCRDQIQELESERDDFKVRMNEALHELDSVAGVLELVQNTQEELDQARMDLIEAHNQIAEHQDRDHSENKTRKLITDLKEKNEKLEKELRASQRDARRLAAKVKEQNQQLKRHRDRMSRDLDGLRDAVKARASSLRHQVTNDATDATPDDLLDDEIQEDELLESVEDLVDETADFVADHDETEEVEAFEEDEVDESQDESTDPVLGSVLAKFNESN